MEKIDCGCKLWRENFHKVESLMMYAWIHGMKYTGVQYKFCPWCSGKLRRSYRDDKKEPEF